MRDPIVEFIGTFFLVLTVGLSRGDPLAIGSVLMVMVYFGGHLSGGHYNPAVTLAVWLRGRFSKSKVLPYWIAQLLGGFAAAATFYFLKGELFGLAPTVAPVQAVFLEFLYTFVLCTVVLTVAATEKLKGNQIYGLAIGLAFLVGVASIGNLTGGALNPAVASGPALAELIWGASSLPNLWIYWVGPLAGGFGAAVTYRYLYRLRPILGKKR